MSKDATVTVRIERGLKQKAEKLLKKVGLSPTEALTIFYMQITLNDGLPFPVKVPNKTTLKAMEDIENRKNLTTHKSVDDLMKDLTS